MESLRPLEAVDCGCNAHGAVTAALRLLASSTTRRWRRQHPSPTPKHLCQRFVTRHADGVDAGRIPCPALRKVPTQVARLTARPPGLGLARMCRHGAGGARTNAPWASAFQYACPPAAWQVKYPVRRASIRARLRSGSAVQRSTCAIHSRAPARRCPPVKMQCPAGRGCNRHGARWAGREAGRHSRSTERSQR